MLFASFVVVAVLSFVGGALFERRRSASQPRPWEQSRKISKLRSRERNLGGRIANTLSDQIRLSGPDNYSVETHHGEWGYGFRVIAGRPVQREMREILFQVNLWKPESKQLFVGIGRTDEELPLSELGSALDRAQAFIARQGFIACEKLTM